MDLRNLRTFLYVAEMASFTRAAEALSYSQSTISFQIKQLEKELGVRLFDRVNHTVILTAKGREVLQYAQRMHQLERELEQTLHAETHVTGHVRLASAYSLCPMLLGEGFAAFVRRHPGITLKITTTETKDMFRMLNQNEADLVLTLDSHIYHAEYVIAQEEKIGTHFVARPDNPLAGRGTLSVRELIGQPFLLTEKGMSYRRLMDEALAAQSLEIEPILEIGSTEQLCELAAQGVGVSFLPDHATATAVREGRLAYLPVADFQIEIWKQLLYHRNKWISPAMQLVMDYCAGREPAP